MNASKRIIAAAILSGDFISQLGQDGDHSNSDNFFCGAGGRARAARVVEGDEDVADDLLLESSPMFNASTIDRSRVIMLQDPQSATTPCSG